MKDEVGDTPSFTFHPKHLPFTFLLPVCRVLGEHIVKWLVALETENDPITTCRLMNIFRRKGLKIVTLAMAAGHAAFSILAVLETPEAEMEHIFNFLRRTEGVQHVTYYRHNPGADASFVFVEADGESSSVARFLEA